MLRDDRCMYMAHVCFNVCCGSGIVSNVADVLGMNVWREMKGVGGLCEMCMCLARVGVGGEGDEWI